MSDFQKVIEYDREPRAKGYTKYNKFTVFLKTGRMVYFRLAPNFFT